MTDPTETVEPGLPDEELRLLAPGTMLAKRYEIDRPLGTGGYAVVYAAYDHELAQRIAIKVLRTDRVTPASLKRLRREVAVAREVSSKRLVRIYDIGQDRELSFITMELVEGISLQKELASGPLELDEALRVAESILEALQLLHTRGIIHRDLKPANVLVTPRRQIKLVDFGLARHWEHEGISATATAAVVGTLEYVSPEQALGRELDPRSDLYSFGVLLYQMLAGQLPFGNVSSLGAVVAHVTRRPPDIRKVRPKTPAWLAILLQQLLEKDPAKRPASAASVHAAINRKRIDWGYRWRRTRAGLYSTIAVILVGTAIGSWAWNHHQSRFDRISSDSDGRLHALDRRGEILWSRDGLIAETRSAAVKVLDGELRVVGIPTGEPGIWDASRDPSRPFETWDAQTGAEKGMIAVPPAPLNFPMPPSFNLSGVNAVDVDHDGLQEVVAAYAHYPYWPGYILFIDPRSGESSILLYASGHHRFLGTIDIDTDGTDEILVGGPNNRMGWRYGVAALQLRRNDISAGPGYAPVNTPDTMHFEKAGTPAWYALLPRRTSYGARLDRVDPVARTFDLVFGDGSREQMSFDGFSLKATSQLPASLRQKRRDAAYEALRTARDSEKRDRPQSALVSLTNARQAARDAKDPELVSWIETVHARMLVQLDQPVDQVRSAIDVMLDERGGGPELCWEVATAYSENANAPAAAEWFMRALDLSTDVGHSALDYLQSAVIALAETGEWERARRLIDAYGRRSPSALVEANSILPFVLWRTGERSDQTFTIDLTRPKTSNYWVLELEWFRGSADPAEFLERVRRTLSMTEEAPWMRSLEADVLASMGRLDDALPIARMAMDAVEKDSTDAMARVHRNVVEERLQRIEGLARSDARR